MDKCIHDDERICMSIPEHDCGNCSIAGRRQFADMGLEEQADFWHGRADRKQIKLKTASGLRHVHGKQFIEAFDRAYKLN